MNCKHCRKFYKSAPALARHEEACGIKTRQRDRLLQRAYPLYAKWFSTHKRQLPSYHTFKASKFGSHFVKFVEWCDTLEVSSLEVYVDVMTKRKLHPQVWYTVDAFRMYKSDFDQTATIEQWLSITAATIQDVTTAAKSKCADFYKIVSPTQLVHLIQQKALYPRVLVCDDDFISYLHKLPSVYQHQVADAIGPIYLEATDCDDIIKEFISTVKKW